jgi:SAM-dependent methyltransferase
MTMLHRVRRFSNRLLAHLFPIHNKEHHELAYWRGKKAAEGVLGNSHYEFFFTDYFGLSHAFYSGKRVLDIGCGPRGSLEWANMTAERVGVDPLASEYLKLGGSAHRMRYVDAPSERMPFADRYFDVVTTLNSLDHVADLESTVREIGRVLKPGGTLLVIVEVNHPPTDTEPITIGWDVPDLFASFADIVSQRKYEIGDHDIYRQIKIDARFDESDRNGRPGIFTGRFVRRS